VLFLSPLWYLDEPEDAGKLLDGSFAVGLMLMIALKSGIGSCTAIYPQLKTFAEALMCVM
jgi:hypothetical protein